MYDGGRPDDRFAGGLCATIKVRVSFNVTFDVGRQSRQLTASVFYFF